MSRAGIVGTMMLASVACSHNSPRDHATSAIFDQAKGALDMRTKLSSLMRLMARSPVQIVGVRVAVSSQHRYASVVEIKGVI